ncbi:RNA-binding protein 7 [Gossypium australe]|uniref:RNA-binding protein 7 n=1 Tax=Gossypium australe TaxID=47621 RepID=A0A5B6V5I5_9ROSI|nr:RNA-binding protein 7 [Gossypium australe]
MSGNSSCSVYIGNLDERVSDRVLYDILIQAGRVVDLYIPRDKETDKPKGFAFVEYETEDVADYAVRLFSGLVTLYNRTLKFAISGQDKSSQNPANAAMPAANSSYKPRHYHGVVNHMETSQQTKKSSTPSRIPDYPARYSQAPPPPGVSHHFNGYGSHINDIDYEYSRRVFGATWDSISRPRSRRYDTSDPISYPFY